jgi:pyruvate dehydrogenase E2 component (dihydrolipoamide acetyltransferase)
VSDADLPAGAPGRKGQPEIKEPSRGERTAARRAAEIRATVPDLDLSTDADAGPALAAAQKSSLTAVLVAACATALREHPEVNAAYRDGRYELYSRVNIAVTLESSEEAVTPVLLDADTKSPVALAAELAELGEQARAGRLRSPQMAGATFSVINAGPHGPDRLTPLVATPQAAALAAGAVRNAAVVREGNLVAGRIVTLTLACDTRILPGARAAAFLARLVAAFEAA